MTDDRWRDGEPFDPTGWLDVGFTLDEARVWRRWRIHPQVAVAWRTAGILDGITAAQWAAAGVRPDTVGDWRAAGIHSGEAVHWHEMGYSLPEALAFKRRGIGPHEAITEQRQQATRSSPMAEGFQRFHDAQVRHELVRDYAMRGWIDDEALAWAKQGAPASDARLWMLLGLTPAEAGPFIRAATAPDGVIRDWWRAGIPYDEVAAWLGAGLTAEEAAAQRADGITAEQAAALRALRDGDDGETD